VPHPRVQLDGLVGAGRALVQRAAHLRVRHRVGLAVQDEERQRHLRPNIQGGNGFRTRVLLRRRRTGLRTCDKLSSMYMLALSISSAVLSRGLSW
jgi:hypothetical protein